MRVFLMMRLLRLGLFLTAASGLAWPQTFEVASIKPSGPKSVRGSDGGPGTKDPGRYTFGRAELQILIMIAWQVEGFQISSRFPLDKDEFDLIAEIAPGTTKEQFRTMLQNLLTERFHLKIHTETKEFPAYELVVAKTGPKLKESSGQSEPAPKAWLQDGFPDLPPNRPGMTSSNSNMSACCYLVRLKAQQQTIARFVGFLRPADHRPVRDRTGLTGIFDFTLEYSVEFATPAADSGVPPASDLNTALQRQLGLQLIAKKLPFDVIVIDSIDRLPAEN